MLRFENWLIEQQHREDRTGALARVPSMQNGPRKTSRRKKDEHKNWVAIVIGIGDPSCISAFNVAWREFLLAKQAIKETQN